MKMTVKPLDGRYFIETKLPDSLRLLFGLSRTLGLLPYASSNDCSISRGWYIYSIFPVTFTIIGSALLSIYTLHYTSYLEKNELTTSLLYHTQEGMQVACLFAHLLSIGLYKSDFDFILKSLPEWGYTGEKSTFAGFWTVIGILFLAFYSTCFPLLNESQWSTYLWYFFLCVNEICVYLIIIQFCSILEMIEIQLKGLTELLNRNRDLVPLTEAHYSFVIKSTAVNSVYSWQILIICTLIFINFVSWLFNAMQDVMQIGADPFKILLKVMYCAWQIATIYFITGSCEAVGEQVETFNSELFRIMRESKKLCDDEKLNLYVSMKQTVNFTACGFFSLGFPLVTSIIAAATTYLVILVQFSLNK